LAQFPGCLVTLFLVVLLFDIPAGRFCRSPIFPEVSNSSLTRIRTENDANTTQKELDVYTDAEANLENQVKEGLATETNLEEFRYNKVTLEIGLLTANGNLSQTHPAPNLLRRCTSWAVTEPVALRNDHTKQELPWLQPSEQPWVKRRDHVVRAPVTRLTRRIPLRFPAGAESWRSV
jgi:hypothetical protein